MKKIIFLWIAAALLYTANATAQKVNICLDYHYNFGLCEHTSYGTISRSDMKLYGNSLHLYALYNIVPQQWAVGAGLGLDRYENPGYNTLPIFATARYMPLRTLPKFFTYTNLGYSIGTTTMTSGVMWDLGIGYQWKFRRHFGLNIQLGYNLKQFRDLPGFEFDGSSLQYVGDSDDVRHSLSLGIGFIF